MARFLKQQWFNIALLALFALALWKPALGESDGPLRPDFTRTAGIVLIFFVTGLTLRLRELRAGAGNRRLHVFNQGFAFVLVPLGGLGVRYAFSGLVPREILEGIVVLSIMPTTITSCVVFTTLAGGNLAGAVFNAVLGNMAGVAVSPILFSLLVAPQAGLHIQWSQLGTLALIIVLPLFAGLLVRRFLVPRLANIARYLTYVSGSALLGIVFFAFTQAFAPDSPLWQWSNTQLLGPFGLILAFHLFFLAAAWLASGLFGLPELDRRTSVFVAPQKTLALGLPLIQVFFFEQPELAGIVSIPLIFYHPLQLVIAGPLAHRLRRRPVESAPSS